MTKINIFSLESLKPYLPYTYAFTRIVVAHGLVNYEEKTSALRVKIILSRGHLLYAGKLIANAKKRGVIQPMSKPNGRYYKFTPTVTRDEFVMEEQ